MLIAISMAVAVACTVALFIKPVRVVGATGLALSLVAIAFGFSRSGDIVRFEGALGAVQILSLTEPPESTTPAALREAIEQRCGARTLCAVVIQPDSETARQAIGDGVADQGAIAIYSIDMLQSRVRFVTRCGVWTDNPEDCFSPSQ